MTLRAARRAVALGASLAVCFLRFWLAHLRGPMSLERRARWLQSSSRLILASLGVVTHVEGRPPARGLVVSNHLSYLDILIYGSIMPCFFVSKVEVRSWPYFGKAACAGGTLFIDRSSRASAASVAREIEHRLALPVPTLFFPEGTSSDGSRVLRFHPSLFEPAAAVGAPVTAAAVRYVLTDGQQERDLCWFDDTVFMAHLWKALSVGFTAEVRFGETSVYADRRSAAAATQAQVTALRAVSAEAQLAEV
jgi:1-acyl-sn-glycerol-3-phosphate acyltransferase